MSHIFISYSRKDLGFAQKIVGTLVRSEKLRGSVLKSAFEGRLV
jgi:hypothetical protein